MTESDAPRDVGVPVRSVNWVSLVVGLDGDDKACLYSTMGQNAEPMLLLQINPETGECRQFRCTTPQASFPTAKFWSERRRRLYIGVAYVGRLLCFDPALDQLEDLGEIGPGASFPCRIDEAPDGSLYIGSFGACDLTRYSPDSGEFTNHGRMDEVDQYFYPLCGADGTVAGLVKMTKPHVVALDPETGEHRAVGPVADTDAGIGSVDFFKGADGLLYVNSHEGAFRVSGLDVVAVDQAPEPVPMLSLPGGATARFLDAAPGFTHRQLEVSRPAGEAKVHTLDWEGAGTDIFVVGAGPDGKLYGSSILPLHLFSHDPTTGESVDYGGCCSSGGELYSLGCHQGLLYTCAYPAAILCAYDPAQPWRPGKEAGANPRELGRMDQVAYRPRDMLCGPAGKVWVASVPDYGMWGGTLASYDPATGEFSSHRHVIQDCSPTALAPIAGTDLIAVGLGVQAGSGATARAERGGLVLWDAQEDRKVWEGDLGIPIHGVMALADDNGLTYAFIHLAQEGTPRAMLALLDLPERKVVSQTVLDSERDGWPLEVCLRGDDDFLYGAAKLSVFRIARGTTALEVLWRPRDEADRPSAAGALIGSDYYFASGHRLRAMRVK